MIIISHRGNIRGEKSDNENKPSYIDSAIGNGYDVEIDIHSIDSELWLGHDTPQYKVEHKWLDERKKYLWLHCKNSDAAKECWKYRSFCHTFDPFTYVSNGKIWLHDLTMEIDDNVIIPLITLVDIKKLTDNSKFSNAFAVCTDYPVEL
jgi:hypothetical protein